MKRFFNYILFCCTAVLIMVSCNKDSVDIPVSDESADHIVLSFLTRQAETKLTAEQFKAIEDKVEHIDVLIFDDDGEEAKAGTLIFHQRMVSPQADTEIALDAKRTDFGENENYWVYVLANSTADETAFSELKDDPNAFGRLLDMSQTDERIFLTGVSASGGQAFPTSFLMDGIAYTGGTATNEAVVLYDGDPSGDTNLKVSLSRAAAKIVVNINQAGDALVFDINQGTGGYSYYNLPYSASLLAEAAHTSALRKSDSYSGDYFDNVSNPAKRVITSYAYSRDWSQEHSIDATRMVVNIPSTYEGEARPHNYYQIPISQSKALERNHVYVVNIDLNIPGAVDPSEPVTVEEAYYTVLDWEDATVNVGDASLNPSYLTLNRYDLAMYNIATDELSLEFASSSEVTAVVDRAYYYNKFGILTDIDPDDYNINVVPDAGINGKLTVNSDIPTNNTIRYIDVTVTNEEGISRSLTIHQYPLIYVTNTLSWYSYRSDFIGTGGLSHYENLSSTRNITRISATRYGNGPYSYSYNSNNSFWRSKVVTSTNSTTGRSDIAYYDLSDWGSGSITTDDAEDASNARMYHVRVTATSSTYRLANPKITGGVTDPGDDNARLVAPSFMIASRLGFVNTGLWTLNLSSSFNQNDLDLVAEHCANYVEVYQDAAGNSVHLDDWRLPTAAEIGIILQIQAENADVDADAIDYLLNAGHYYSASGPVANENSNSSGVSVRCIRNAY